MNRCEWIVCERTGLWAATLRTVIARTTDAGSCRSRLYEVRSDRELAARLDECPRSLALVEVRLAEFGTLLSWLVEAQANYRDARFVALLGSELSRHPVTDLLLQAGACDVAESPRHLHDMMALAQRHAALAAAAQPGVDEVSSLRDWAWSLLPWQND